MKYPRNIRQVEAFLDALAREVLETHRVTHQYTPRIKVGNDLVPQCDLCLAAHAWLEE